MKKVEFAELLMKKGNLVSKEEAKRQVELFIEVLKEALVLEEEVIFRGLGTFEKRTTKRTEGINPRTREPLAIKPKKYIKFKVGKDLSEKLNTEEKPKKKKSSKKK